MQSTAMKLNNLLGSLEEEDYDKAISYIEFLVDRRKGKILNGKFKGEKTDVEVIVASLIGAIPDEGKSLEEYRRERLKKYEDPC